MVNHKKCAFFCNRGKAPMQSIARAPGWLASMLLEQRRTARMFRFW